MQNLINDLRLMAEKVERKQEYLTSNDVSMTTASILIVLAKVLEEVKNGDEELLGIFAAHLIEFLDRFNDDKDSDENMNNFQRLESLLDGIDLGD